jgi:repressor LexA
MSGKSGKTFKTEKILTVKQKALLDFITEQVSSRNSPPTYDEMAERFGYKSKNSVETHLRGIIRKGFLKKAPGKSRGLLLVRSPGGRERPPGIPLLGTIAAGQPLYAAEHIEEYLDLYSLFHVTPGMFALRVKGESMIKAGIFDGDIVIFRKQEKVEDGEIAAVLVNDEATIKRVYLRPNKLVLRPENDSMTDMVYDRNDGTCLVLGKMEGLVRGGG